MRVQPVAICAAAKPSPSTHSIDVKIKCREGEVIHVGEAFMRSSDLLMHCALKSTVGAEPASIAPQSIVAQVKYGISTIRLVQVWSENTLNSGDWRTWPAIIEGWDDPRFRQHYLHGAPFEELEDVYRFARDFGIKSLQEVVAEQLWHVASDFMVLCHLNCMFLQGQLHFTPYHSGPPLAETWPLVPDLLRLNRLGVFTYNSSPYELEVVAEDVSVECEQRPYLECILSARTTPKWRAFFDDLKALEGLAVEGHAITAEASSLLAGSENIDGIPHFRFRSIGGDWTPYQPYHNACEEWHWDPREDPVLTWQNILDNDPIVMRIIAERWGPVDLHAAVVQVAQACLTHTTS